MRAPRGTRERLAGVLNAAFAEGLLSEQTHSHRLGMLFAPGLVEPDRIVGDLSLRGSSTRPSLSRLASAPAAFGGLLRRVVRTGRRPQGRLVLGLDWSGGCEQLTLGRAPSCDIVLRNQTVSRRHAELAFRDGAWVVRDLGSTNGVVVNGVPVGRCRLRPGDRLSLGLQTLDVD